MTYADKMNHIWSKQNEMKAVVYFVSGMEQRNHELDREKLGPLTERSILLWSLK